MKNSSDKLGFPEIEVERGDYLEVNTLKKWRSPTISSVDLLETKGSKEISSNFEGTWGPWTISAS